MSRVLRLDLSAVFRAIFYVAVLLLTARTVFAQTATSTSLSVTTTTISGITVARLTASVQDGNSQPLTAGEVHFFDGTLPIGSAQLVQSTVAGFQVGTATQRRPAGPGSHSFSATYIGDATHAASTSAPQSLTVAGTANTDAKLYPAGAYPMADIPTSITLADVNGDGLPDIVLPTQTDGHGVTILLNDSSHPGTFLAPVYVPNSPNSSNAVISDLDGDGLVDIVAGYPDAFSGDSDISAGAASIFMQDPASPGTFKQVNRVWSNLIESGHMSVQDMNGDGVPDIVFSSNYYNAQKNDYGVGANVAFQDTTSRGSFSNASDAWTAYGYEGFATSIADLDGDGAPEVIFSGDQQTAKTMVFYGDAQKRGGFTSAGYYPSSPTVFDSHIADLNHDGHPDLILGAVFNGLQVLSNDPKSPGSFLAPTVYPVFDRALGVDTGDFNGDGVMDVAVANHSNAFSIWTGNPDGSLTSPATYSVVGEPTRPAEIEHIAVGDIDGDGLDDVVVISGFYDYVHVPNFQINVLTHKRPDSYKPQPAILLTGTPSEVQLGTPVTLTATLSSAFGTPTGVVSFSIGGTNLGSATIDANGKATLTTTALPASTQGTFIVADYEGDTNFTPATSLGLYIDVMGIPSTTTVTVSPGQSELGQSVTVKVQVSGTSTPPTGTIHLTTTAYSMETAPVVLSLDSSGALAYTTTLPIATTRVTAYYSGDTLYAQSIGNSPTTVQRASLAISASDTSTVPTGPVTFTATLSSLSNIASRSIAFYDNQVLQYTATTDSSGVATWAVPALGPGTHQIVATFLAPSAVGNVSTNPLYYSLPKFSATANLSSDTTSLNAGQSVHLAVTVRPATGTLAPAGTVTFFEDGAAIGTATLDTSGAASFETPALLAGTRSFYASYSGNSVYNGVNSNNVTVSAIPPDFTLAATPTGLSLGLGQSGTTSLTVTPTGGFSDQVNLTCLNLPVGISCAFSPATLAIGSSPGTSTLTITAPLTAWRTHREFSPASKHPSGSSFWAIVLPCCFGAACSRKRSIRLLCMAAVASGLLLFTVACSTSSKTAPFQPSSTTTLITVAAAGKASGTTHNVQFTLTY